MARAVGIFVDDSVCQRCKEQKTTAHAQVSPNKFGHITLKRFSQIKICMNTYILELSCPPGSKILVVSSNSLRVAAHLLLILPDALLSSSQRPPGAVHGFS